MGGTGTRTLYLSPKSNAWRGPSAFAVGFGDETRPDRGLLGALPSGAQCVPARAGPTQCAGRPPALAHGTLHGGRQGGGRCPWDLRRRVVVSTVTARASPTCRQGRAWSPRSPSPAGAPGLVHCGGPCWLHVVVGRALGSAPSAGRPLRGSLAAGGPTPLPGCRALPGAAMGCSCTCRASFREFPAQHLLDFCRGCKYPVH